MGWWGGVSSPPGGGRSPFGVPTGVSETESFQRMSSGEERTFGGETGGIAFSTFDRLTDSNQLYQHGDARALQMDVESIEALEHRFQSEFRQADQHVRERKPQRRLLYDYDNDRRFQDWKADQAQIRKRLQIHWLDDLIDHPMDTLVYLGRIFTTAGLMYGTGRTVYLYRMMDKAYAKLNGVSLASIAATEVSLAICKGAAVAVSGTAGVLAGETAACLGSFALSGDVSMPERNWYHIWCCGAFAGVGAGSAFAAVQFHSLTPWGCGAFIGAFTAVFGGLGFHLGYNVYRPFAEQRTHRLYEPYWRPWNERLVGYGGPHHVRGRYT